VKSKALPIIIGSAVTLTLGTIALMALPAYYHGDIPLLPAVLAPILCSLSGGYVAARLAQDHGLATGALSGLVAGLSVVVLATLFARLAVTVAAILVACIFVASGASGGCLARIRFSPEVMRARHRDARTGQRAGSVAWPPMQQG